MKSEDFELQERVVPVAVRLTLHVLDLGVGPLQRSGRNWVVIVVQDPVLMLFQRLGKLLQHITGDS